MRMSHYFAALAVLVAPALLLTILTGIWFQGGNMHLSVGLFSALLAVAAETLLILFMIITGRVLRAAMETRPLDKSFLDELNAFFAEQRAYPIAGMAAVGVTAAAVLGYGKRAFGAPPAVHIVVGLLAVALVIWSLKEGWHALRANQALLDRTASELDRIDREQPDAVQESQEDGLEPGTAVRRWTLAALAGWIPYLYWGLIEWRGDFSRVHIVWPLGSGLFCAYALLCAALAQRALAHLRREESG